MKAEAYNNSCIQKAAQAQELPTKLASFIQFCVSISRVVACQQAGKSGTPRIVLSKDFRNALESIDFCHTTRLQRIQVRKNPFTE